jgi:hypothetical protein
MLGVGFGRVALNSDSDPLDASMTDGCVSGRKAQT